MESKFYVSLEAARLLKEKGYDEKTDFFIDEYGIWEWDGRAILDLPCPTKAEAIDWLESKGIIVEAYYDYNAQWGFTISRDNFEIHDSWWHDELLFPTRLEAEDAAIIKALELLK